MSSLMASMVDRMAIEMACGIVRDDFGRDASQRRLFPSVESDDKPDSSAGETAIRLNLQHLHKHVLGQDLAVDDPEIDRSFNLFSEVWQAVSTASNYNPGCSVNDPDNTLKSWMLVMIYLMGSYDFLYE